MSDLADFRDRQHIDLASLQQGEGFSHLDSKVQTIIVSLESKQSSFGELSDLISQEQKSAKEHVTEKLHQHQRDRDKDEYFAKYLESLTFPGIRTRQEAINEPYKKTFDWIFDESGKAVRPWGNFVEWLMNGRGVYWIRGKAGSGKSTLMNYICEDQRTKASLKTWAGTHELLVIPFFFWKAGRDSRMQKTSAGLLRSLVHQILEKVPHLILSLAQTYNDPQAFQTDPHRFPVIPVWTETRLLTTLQRLLVELSSSFHLCLFIDGLDEIDGSHNDLVELLSHRVRGPNIKMCLSSRPDRSFVDAFGSSAMLRLEDLTREDIAFFVSRKLRGACRQKPLPIQDSMLVPRMTDSIVQKAQGVFQWVRIVVEYQIQGLQSKDSLEELEERVNLLPDEIETLYAHMLRKVDQVHRKEVASYFQIILQISGPPSVSEMALALYGRRDELLLPHCTLPLSEIASRCTSVRERIDATCAGLLEVHGDHSQELEDIGVEFASFDLESALGERSSSAFQPKDLSIWTSSRCTRIHLLHRTAYDFLKKNPAGKEFLETNASSNFDVYRAYCNALLAQLVISTKSDNSYYTQARSESQSSSFRDDVNTIMKFACYTEDMTKRAQTGLNEDIDRVITDLGQQCFNQPPDTHWCTRWGFTQEVVDQSRRNWSERSSFRASPDEPGHNIQDISTIPLNFLSFAASHGLYLYVLDVLPTRFERRDPDTMTVLLHFTLAYKPREVTALSLELGVVLLRRGADPNFRSTTSPRLSSTVWSSFLTNQGLQDVGFDNRSGIPIIRQVERTPTEKEWILAARTFIEKGANVNAVILSGNVDAFDWIVSGDMGPELKRFDGIAIRANVSVLAYLDTKAHLPIFAEIRKMCVARGAIWTIRVNRGVLIRMRSGGYKRFQLSQRQANIIEELSVATHSLRIGTPVSTPLEVLRTMLIRLHDELKLAETEEDVQQDVQQAEYQLVII